MRPNKIPVLNPTRHGACWTGRNRAERYVRTGRAVFVGLAAIRFVETDPRNVAAAKKGADAAAGYDDIRRTLTVGELAHIPFVNPLKSAVDFSARPARAAGRELVPRIAILGSP